MRASGVSSQESGVDQAMQAHLHEEPLLCCTPGPNPYEIGLLCDAVLSSGLGWVGWVATQMRSHHCSAPGRTTLLRSFLALPLVAQAHGWVLPWLRCGQTQRHQLAVAAPANHRLKCVYEIMSLCGSHQPTPSWPRRRIREELMTNFFSRHVRTRDRTRSSSWRLCLIPAAVALECSKFRDTAFKHRKCRPLRLPIAASGWFRLVTKSPTVGEVLEQASKSLKKASTPHCVHLGARVAVGNSQRLHAYTSCIFDTIWGIDDLLRPSLAVKFAHTKNRAECVCVMRALGSCVWRFLHLNPRPRHHLVVVMIRQASYSTGSCRRALF
jgi:hypothetical protein